MKLNCKSLTVMGAVALALSLANPLQAAKEKPNILVIFADDVGYWNVSHNNRGMMGYKTPNIDRIAKQGTRFENYYCSDAPCLPSRTSMMTGQFGIRSGVVGHGGTAADPRLEGESRDFRDRLAHWVDGHSLPMMLRRAIYGL